MKYNLSEITEVIKNRRTIYPEQYTERKIHKEIVEDVLNNAIWAPTHGKTQPWRFQVFMNESRNELSSFLSGLYSKQYQGEAFNKVKFNKLKNRPLESPVVIAVTMTPDVNKKISEIERLIIDKINIKFIFRNYNEISFLFLINNRNGVKAKR